MDAAVAIYNLECVSCGAQATEEPWGQTTPATSGQAGQPIGNVCLKCITTAEVRWPWRQWSEVVANPQDLAQIATMTAVHLGGKPLDFLPKGVEMTQKTRCYSVVAHFTLVMLECFIFGLSRPRLALWSC